MNESQSKTNNSENENLNTIFDEKKSELAYLIVRRDDMVYHKKFAIENEFFRLLGPEKVESAFLELQIRKLKVTIELIQMDINRNVIPNLQIIEQMVEREILEWESKLLDFKAKLLGSLIIEGNLLDSKESIELNTLYFYFVKKLHPDLIAGYNEDCEMLWEGVHNAFKNSDINAMKCFFYLQKNNDLKFGLDNSDLKKEMITFDNLIDSLNFEIDSMSEIYPYNLEENMDNPAWIENERYRLQGHIADYQQDIDTLNYQLNKLKVIINGQLNQN